MQLLDRPPKHLTYIACPFAESVVNIDFLGTLGVMRQVVIMTFKTRVRWTLPNTLTKLLVYCGK